MGKNDRYGNLEDFIKNRKNTNTNITQEEALLVPYEEFVQLMGKRTVEVPFSYCHRLIKDY